MGLFRDREADLTELQRLILRIREPGRRAELGAGQWATAMVAYALEMCEDPNLLNEGLEIYAAYVQKVPEADRAAALSRLGSFISGRRGEGWRALLLFTQGEFAAPRLCSRAAMLALTLAAPAGNTRLAGAAALVRLVEQGSASPAVLSALLSVADLRLLPLVAPLCALPAEQMAPYLDGLNTTLNSLSAEWLLRLLEARPTLAPGVTAALVRLAGQTPLVADLVYPMPTWAYTRPAPQPLHAWTLPEFLPRMRARLAPHLTAEQMRLLEGAFV